MARRHQSGGSSGPVTFETGRVADVMTWGFLSCAVSETREVIARMLSAHRVHAVVVLGTPDTAEGERPLWGIISDLDLMRAASSGSTAGAYEIAQRPATTVTPDDTLVDAARAMAEDRTSHLVVADPATGRPLGIVSSLDIAGVLALR